MAFRSKRFLKKVVSWSGLFFFGLAAYMLYSQLSKYAFSDIKNAVLSIPSKNLILAGIASFLGYVALSSYDYLAIRYVGKKLSPLRWIFAGFIGFSVSNNAGHAIVSGGAIRYRLYTRWRFHATDILKMVTFSGFTYLFGCFFLIILGYFLTPNHAFGEGSVSHMTTLIITIVSVVGLLLYFWATLYYKKPIVIKEIEFDVPSFKMALVQTFVGGVDILMASLVLYFSLISFVDIPFDVFIGVFIIAQVLGVFSQVPGGLGVFEGLFMFIIPGEHNQALLFGALIAYRIIYYLFPLLISGIVLVSYEWYLRYVKSRILLEYLKEKAEHLKAKKQH